MVAANTRRTTLIVAVVLALGTGLLTLTYLSRLQRQSNANSAPVQVVVAAEAIPPRVPITPEMLAHVTRPAAAIDPNTIHDPKQVVGQLSLITIPAGASLTSSMIGSPSDAGLPVRLTDGMRAVSIQVDKVKGLSGLLQPGDRVDVIAQAPKTDNVPPPASTILRGVRVLAIGDSLEYSSATPSPQEETATTVTLEVTPKQADMLVMADINATLRLALRSPKEPINSEPTEALHFGSSGSAPEQSAPSSGVLADSALIKALDARNDPARTPAVAPAAPVHASAVTIIDGDHYAAQGAQ